jgi:hypothetical protein
MIENSGVAGGKCIHPGPKLLVSDSVLRTSELFALVEDFERFAHAGFVR